METIGPVEIGLHGGGAFKIRAILTGSLFEVVDSSFECSRNCLGLFPVMKSNLLWRAPWVYNDWL